ncbi:DUF881 domain-containing protein [Dermabacteraceae bacterium P7074]
MEQQEISGWQRIRNILRPRWKLSQVVVGILCLLVGLTIAIQVRETRQEPLDQMSQQDLVRLLDESNRHVGQLQQESRELETTLRELENGQQNSLAARAAAQERLKTLQVLAGEIPAQGPGVRVIVADGGAGVKPQTLLTVLEELRNAGAEVVQLNSVRIVASSSITGKPGQIVVDKKTLKAPYEFRVIGPADVIDPALKIPGGAADTVTSDGGDLTVSQLDNVTINEVVPPSEFQHAKTK